ncbi:MAG: MmcQ/YjbR family DNA-binding protein [bacterium]|nr:MmcQ/YjbR family DNA-binding protein [bacterium]
MGTKKADKPLRRVREFALALPNTSERLSHGQPTFFVNNKVFVMFSKNSHNDRHAEIVLPTPPLVKAALIEAKPYAYYQPANASRKNWIGIEVAEIEDVTLKHFIEEAWKIVMSS